MPTIVSLTTEEAASSGYSHKIILKAADLKLLTKDTVASIYPGHNNAATNTNLLVKTCDVFIKTAVACTGTYTATIGDGTTADKFTTIADLKSAGWNAGSLTAPFALPNNLINITPSTDQGSIAATAPTAGEVHICLMIVDGDTISKS